MMKRLILTVMTLPLVLGSCHDTDDVHGGDVAGRVRLALTEYGGAGSPDSPESDVDGMAGYHFVDGKLKYVYDLFSKTSGGYDLRVNSLDGTLYVVAWTGASAPHERPGAGTAESDWTETLTDSGDMFFTGSGVCRALPRRPFR